MNVLIVLAHPEAKSLNGELARTAQRVLEQSGHSVAVSDLYALGFNPVGGPNDFTHELGEEPFIYQVEQKRAALNDSFEPMLKAEMDKLVAADLVIFQFPLWWFSVPAILKGWIDRVFAYHFAYGGGRWYDSGVFRGKKALLSLTVGGGSSAYQERGLQGEMMSLLFPLWHGTFEFVGMSALKPHVIYQADNKTDGPMSAQIEAFGKRMYGIFEEDTLPMPKLSDYGPDLVRK